MTALARYFLNWAMSTGVKMVEIKLHKEADTERLGERLAQILPACIVALDGTLGAGKTRLVRAFATACGVDEKSVTSPTFTLWQTYNGNRMIHHLDAYRINDEDEFNALGVEECFETDAIVFIEWAERIRNCLPKENQLSVAIEVISEHERSVTISSNDPALRQLLDKLVD